ncbi:protein PXR1, partial [Plectosphaerella plurivora]
MGLAEIKFRRKIDKDPNNTKWLRDESSFGQKILRAQGWEPGQYLGAKDAAQAEHYTAANASFVRVSLKDDMLGLGFKQSKDEQVTGMNAFQDMLARLNGKTEELAKAKEAQVAVQTTLYCDSKFGPMRFVRGGWLVGDTLQESPAAKLKAAEDAKTESKKRKVEDVSDSDSSSEDEKARKKRRKEERKAAKKLKAKSGSNTPADKSDETDASEKDKKKKSKSKKDSAATTEDETDAKSKSKKSKKSKRDADSTDSDAEKAAKKEKKRLKKEQKRAEKASSTSTPSATGTSTPAAAKSGTSTPILRGHHAVRSKWIKSKSMATLDDAALNQ